MPKNLDTKITGYYTAQKVYHMTISHRRSLRMICIMFLNKQCSDTLSTELDDP